MWNTDGRAFYMLNVIVIAFLWNLKGKFILLRQLLEQQILLQFIFGKIFDPNDFLNYCRWSKSYIFISLTLTIIVFQFTDTSQRFSRICGKINNDIEFCFEIGKKNRKLIDAEHYLNFMSASHHTRIYAIFFCLNCLWLTN